MKGKNKLKKRKKKRQSIERKKKYRKEDTFRVIGFTRNLIIFDKV